MTPCAQISLSLVLVCHGSMDKKEDRPILWLEHDDGSSDLVAGEMLVQRITDLDPDRRPLLIILAACQTAGLDQHAAVLSALDLQYSAPTAAASSRPHMIARRDCGIPMASLSPPSTAIRLRSIARCSVPMAHASSPHRVIRQLDSTSSAVKTCAGQRRAGWVAGSRRKMSSASRCLRRWPSTSPSASVRRCIAGSRGRSRRVTFYDPRDSRTTLHHKRKGFVYLL